MRVFIENLEKYLYGILLRIMEGLHLLLEATIDFLHFCYNNLLATSALFFVLICFSFFMYLLIDERNKSIGARLYGYFLVLGAWVLFFMYGYKIGSWAFKALT